MDLILFIFIFLCLVWGVMVKISHGSVVTVLFQHIARVWAVNPYVNLLTFSYPSNYSFSFQINLITIIAGKYSALFADIYIAKCLKVQ